MKQLGMTAAPEAAVMSSGGPQLRDYFSYLSLRRVAKMVYGVVVCLAVGELALALFRPQQATVPQDLVVADAALGFRMVPNYRGVEPMHGTALETNSYGLRERELGPPGDSQLRVYVLGDSIVFGLGIEAEDAFPRALERVLQRRLGRQVEVVNGGVPGYGTLQQLELFEETVERLQPDIVLASVSVFNDVADNVKFAMRHRRWQKTPNVIYRPLRWLRQHSQLYLLLRQYRSGVSGEKMMDIHAVRPSTETDRGLQMTEESLVTFAEVARQRGVAFGVIVLPAQKQVSPKTWAETLRSRKLPPERYSHEMPNRRVVEFARKQSLPAMDLLPLLYEDHEDLYENEHWTKAGHVFVAEAVADFMQTSKLIDAANASAAADAPRPTRAEGVNDDG
jgi:hypothetical protein